MTLMRPLSLLHPHSLFSCPSIHSSTLVILSLISVLIQAHIFLFCFSPSGWNLQLQSKRFEEDSRFLPLELRGSRFFADLLLSIVITTSQEPFLQSKSNSLKRQKTLFHQNEGLSPSRAPGEHCLGW
jgi:hypothetical protein